MPPAYQLTPAFASLKAFKCFKSVVIDFIKASYLRHYV